jgi:hypothetical protein
MKQPNLGTAHITEVVATYFRCVMLSHRWDGKEPLLQDIQDKIVFMLNSLGGIVKLQKFCEIACDAGFRWAWSDTCCIDKTSHAELQESLNSMFIWYHQSALTIVYLSDVPPLSKSGALAKSEWNKRGWTFQEFVAPKVVLFYQADWTLYLDDHSPSHKQSAAIMEELESATGIDRQALVVFHPGMNGVRETSMGIDTHHHGAGRHRILVVWHMRCPSTCKLWREEAKCARTAPAGDRGSVRRYYCPRLDRTILQLQ